MRAWEAFVVCAAVSLWMRSGEPSANPGYATSGRCEGEWVAEDGRVLRIDLVEDVDLDSLAWWERPGGTECETRLLARGEWREADDASRTFELWMEGCEIRARFSPSKSHLLFLDAHPLPRDDRLAVWGEDGTGRRWTRRRPR